MSRIRRAPKQITVTTEEGWELMTDPNAVPTAEDIEELEEILGKPSNNTRAWLRNNAGFIAVS
jgi:hypothetical protein